MTPLAQKAVLILLCLALLVSGCAAPRSLGARDAIDTSEGADFTDALAPVSSERRVAKIVLLGLVLGVLILVDIALLPSYHHHEAFVCTRSAVRWCR